VAQNGSNHLLTVGQDRIIFWVLLADEDTDGVQIMGTARTMGNGEDVLEVVLC